MDLEVQVTQDDQGHRAWRGRHARNHAGTWPQREFADRTLGTMNRPLLYPFPQSSGWGDRT